MWPYLQEYAGVIPGVVFNVSELRCDLPNGCRIYLLGAENSIDEYSHFYDLEKEPEELRVRQPPMAYSKINTRFRRLLPRFEEIAKEPERIIAVESSLKCFESMTFEEYEIARSKPE